VRSVVALGVAGAALIVWSVMMAFMVFNYLLMLFVPGAPSTREVWKKICGGSRGVSSSSAASACSMTSIPSNLSTKDDEERSRVRFCNIFFNVPRSCLGAWCRDVMALEFGHVVDDDRVPVARRATADTAPLVAGAAAAVGGGGGAARGAHEDAEELQLDE
jgi:hypothetical protein